MLEHARQFLNRVMPPIEGQAAYLNIHWSAIGTEGKRFWDGRACSSVDDAIKSINWAMKLGGKDIYVCMSLQARTEIKTSAKGNSYNKALRFADDAVALRSLFIDVDVKEEAYPDTASALRAFQGFITSVGMPHPSAVVGSGSGGFHAHWALDEVLTRDQWQVLANALAAATVQHGLITDTQCTVDSARILRIPETLNLKSDQPKPVTLMSLSDEVSTAKVREVLEPYKLGPHQVAANMVTKPGPKIAANDELGANMPVSNIPEIRIEDVAKSCGFIARTLGTGGKDNAQPVWFLTGTLATFVEDGQDALHLMSNGHAGYDMRATDELYNRLATKGKERDIGWPKCAKIASYGCTECASCPLLVQGKSPLNFATPASPVAAVDATLPERFLRGVDGIISIRSVQDDGTMLAIPICHYPIYSGWLSNNPWTFHFMTRTGSGRKVEMDIPTEVIFGREGINKYLGSKGFFCSDPQYKILKDFFVAWLQKLQNAKDSVISAAPFGWSVVDGTIEGFSYSGRVWMHGNDRPAANPNPQLVYQYSPKGDLQIWRDLAKVIYSQNRPGLDAILSVAFAGPLVRFTGFSGLILNSYSSKSGIGKTTAMKVSQAVWANPTLAMQGLNDTANSVLSKMGQIRSLPAYWDEIKSPEQIKRFCGIVFDLTGGREKTRLNADSTLKQSGTWQTILVSASNDSLVDHMGREVGSTTAGIHRIFEYIVPKSDVEAGPEVGVIQRLLGKLDDNYGQPGLVYSKFLGANWKRVEAEVAALQDELYTEVKVKQEERMWIASMTVVIKGAEYANELGLTDINIQQLRAFLMDVLEKMRSEVGESTSDLSNDMSMSSILAEFLSSTRARNTLVTNRIWVSKGRPTKGAIQILSNVAQLGEIMVQIGREDGLMRIRSTALTKWMGERNYSRHTFVKRLHEEFGLQKVNGKIGGGTELSCAVEHLFELDMNHPKLSTFIG